jgi:FkbM family methyltransferase
MYIDQAFRTFARPDDVAFDVGAFKGDVAMALAEAVGTRGRVFAFEPHPLPYLILAARSAYATIVAPFCKAMSDEIGHAVLHFDSSNDTSQASTLVENLATKERLGDHIRTVKVETDTIDAFCAARRLAPQFIKIDTEGAEARVIRGAQATIAAYHPSLVIETHFFDEPGTPRALVPPHILYLEQRGYLLYVIDVYYHAGRHSPEGDRFLTFPGVVPVRSEDFLAYPNLGVNLLAVHRSRTMEVPLADNMARLTLAGLLSAH